MDNLLLVAVTCLAVYRGSRLVAVDRLLLAPRQRVQDWFEMRWVRRHPDRTPDPDEWNSMGAYLLGCVWCSSVWVGALVIPAVDLAVELPYPWLIWVASSAVSGWLASNEGD